jgi:hypothetical protein
MSKKSNRKSKQKKLTLQEIKNTNNYGLPFKHNPLKIKK